MTDRVNALTVVLDREMRDDDVQVVVDAIKMIKFVRSVDTNIADMQDHIAYVKARSDLGARLWEALNEK